MSIDVKVKRDVQVTITMDGRSAGALVAMLQNGPEGEAESFQRIRGAIFNALKACLASTEVGELMV